MSVSLHVLILAAGTSKRMPNQIKQLLPWKHNTLLGNAIEQVQSLEYPIHVVLGAYANTIAQTLPSGVYQHINPDWEKGMGNSIAYGVGQILEKSSSVDAILIMMPDQPLIDVSHLQQLQTNYLVSDNIKIVATAYKNGKKGVPAIFDGSVFNELRSLDADFGARNIIQKYAHQTKSIAGLGKEVDVDTFEEYIQLTNQ